MINVSMLLVNLAKQTGWVERLGTVHLLVPLRILGLVLFAASLTIAVRTLVRRLTESVLTLPGADRDRAKVRQRALGTVLRSTLVGAIWVTVAITVIGELGVNIGAFVATATIIGGALAFGAQTLVRDAIAGFFVIAEDQYGLGDVVDVGHATGVVERITLRSVRLRDGEGRVWHVPHGGVIRTANLSKSPKVLLDLEVSRTSHLDNLERVSAALCDELRAHTDFDSALLGAPEVVGLTEVRDDRLVYRLSVTTRPGEQDRVKQFWRTAALRAFERGDIVAPAAPSTVVNIGREVGDL
jgi:moderate conductance mechanosensitive channel